MTGAGAVDSLRDRKTIGIIGNPDFASQRAAQVGLDWSSVEPGRARALGDSGERVK